MLPVTLSLKYCVCRSRAHTQEDGDIEAAPLPTEHAIPAKGAALEAVGSNGIDQVQWALITDHVVCTCRVRWQ